VADAHSHPDSTSSADPVSQSNPDHYALAERRARSRHLPAGIAEPDFHAGSRRINADSKFILQ
jgi:hypothetical protein